MAAIAVSNPTAVFRGGATAFWSSFSSGLPGLCGGFEPGVVGSYVRFKLQPSPALSALPPVVTMSVTANKIEGDLFCDIADDVAGLGDSGGILTASVAAGARITSGVRTYAIPTAGITLSALNAGNVYFFLAYRSRPTSNEFSSGWTVGISPTSPVQQDGSASASNLTTDFQVTPAKAVTSDYVIVDFDATMRGSGANPGLDPLLWEGTLSGSALGQSGSEGFESPPDPGGQIAATLEYGAKRRLTPNAAASVPVTANVSLSFAGTGIVARATTELVGTVVTPELSTLRLTQVSASYAVGGGTPLGSPLMGAFDQEIAEMTRYLDDEVALTLQTFLYATGAAADADSLPTFRVYEVVTDTPVLTASFAKLDDSNTVGLYGAVFTASAGNGFEVGKTYAVRASATVDGVAQAGVVDRFVVRAPVAQTVWSAALGADSAGAPSTTGGGLRRVVSKLCNRMVKSGNLVTTYGDDSSTALATQQYSVTDAGFDRSRDV